MSPPTRRTDATIEARKPGVSKKKKRTTRRRTRRRARKK